MDAHQEISTKQLLEALESEGFHVTPTQLLRWQRNDLIPRPAQRGLGRGAGSITYYPLRAVVQVRRVVELRRVRRDIGWIGWQLWFEGHEVGEKYWRPVLERAYKNLRRGSRLVARLLRVDARSGSDKTVFDQVAEDRRAFSPLNLTWHLFKIEDRARLVRIIAHVCSGNETDLTHFDIKETEADERSFFQHSGLQQSDRNFILGNKLNAGSQISSILADLALSVRELNAAEDFSQLANDELLPARNYVRDAFVTVSNFSEATSWVFGKSSFGLRVMKSFSNARPPLLTATIILLWWQLSRRTGVDFLAQSELSRLRETAEKLLIDSQALQALSKEPTFQSVLSRNSIRDGLSSEQKFGRFLRRLSMVASGQSENQADEEAHI